MPSRIIIALILLFWFATMGHIVYRDVWPRLFGDVPPTIAIELIDEATQRTPTRWSILRGDEQIGTLTSRMMYIEKDDSFLFINSYNNLGIDVGKFPSLGNITMLVPKMDVTIRINRDGELLEQSYKGRIELQTNGIVGISVDDFSSEGTVTNGMLTGNVRVKSSFFSLERELEPVPVPQGQILNPMMPLNRLDGVTPGQRWVIREVNPLGDAIVLLIKEAGKKAPIISKIDLSEQPAQLIAEVREEPTKIVETECWLIEYRDEKVVARTWVSVADGRVMRQEAIRENETLRFERQE